MDVPNTVYRIVHTGPGINPECEQGLEEVQVGYPRNNDVTEPRHRRPLSELEVTHVLRCAYLGSSIDIDPEVLAEAQARRHQTS